MTFDRTTRERKTRDVLVVLLAINSGATDAIGFLAFGGAFTSVMTGNMVLLGLSATKPDATLARLVAVAITCYIGGCVFGARIAGTAEAASPVWPPSVTNGLRVEAALILTYAIGWWASDGHPGASAQMALLGVNAVALGVQSSTVQRFGVSGLSTTYLTGTLTTVIVRLTSGRSVREVAHSVSILFGLIGGAALGTLVEVNVPMLTPFVQIGSLGIVLIVAALTWPRAIVEHDAYDAEPDQAASSTTY